MNQHTRTFTASPAVRTVVPLLIGIMSPSGGGKTFSALRLATGIQQVFGGDICVLDTENRRALHYADRFKFIHVPFGPPFGSLDYLAAIKHCATLKPCVTIVDSMTHEHVGEGGYLETAEQVVTRIAGDDYKKREAAKFAGWAKAGPLRTQMIEGIKQLNGNFIFCWRAKEKTKPMRVNGKFEAVEMGLMPIAGEEWVYEMALNCMLPPRSGGVPTWRSDHVGERLMMKLPDQFKGIFAENKPLDEEIGRQLAEWAKGGPAPAKQSNDMDDEETFSDRVSRVDQQLADAAELGWSALKEVWNALPEEIKETLHAANETRHKPRAREISAQQRAKAS